MPEERAVQAVHGEEEIRRGGGQHQFAVPVPARTQVPQASHGRRRRPGQSLHRGPHTHLLRLLSLTLIDPYRP